MSNFWLQLWNHRKYAWLDAQSVQDGETLDHTASDQFRRWGVQPGDLVYVVAVSDGHLHLIGRLQVEKICDQQEAEQYFGHIDLWEANDHLIAKRGTATPQRANLMIPDKAAAGLTFQTKRGRTTLDAIDGRRLQTLRRLTPESARRLDNLLEDAERAKSRRR